MSFQITVPSKHAAMEVSPTFKGDLALVFDNEVMTTIAKQLISEMNIADLAHLFDAKQIEALKKAISAIELENEAGGIGLIK